MKTRSILLGTAACLLLAGPAAAQNSASEPPVVAAPPPTKSEPAPPPPAPPATSTPAPSETPAAPPPVVVVPQTSTAPPPMEPVTIDPDAAYPNGFADPNDPFANDMSLAYREERGFDWGLLGLLGLLGLIPLFRERGRYARTVYVERDDPAATRRVVRSERIEE